MGIDLTKYQGSSGFLKAADFKPNQSVEVIISDVSEDSYQDEPQLVLSFTGKEKKLSLNRTNFKTCVKLFGLDTDNWLNKPIVLYHDPNVTLRGEIVGGLRLRAPYEPGLDDDIPDF